MSDYESSNDETFLAIIEQFKPTPNKSKGKRRRRSNLQHELLKNGLNRNDLSPEELEKLRKQADAERKKRRRREMTAEERKQFLERENERKRRQRLKPEFDVNRAKEAERKREKRRSMTTEEGIAFRAKDAERKRLARLKKKLEQAKENESAYDTSNSNEPPLVFKTANDTPNGTQNSLNDTMLKSKRGRPRKDKENKETAPASTKKRNSGRKPKSITNSESDGAMKQFENFVYDIVHEQDLMADKEVKDKLLKIVDTKINDPQIVKNKLENMHSTILNKPIVLQKVKTQHDIILSTSMKCLKSPEVDIDGILKAETPPLMLHDSSLSEYESAKAQKETITTEKIVNSNTISTQEEEIVLEIMEISDENILKRQAEIQLELEEISKENLSNPPEENIIDIQEEFALEVTEISVDEFSNEQDEVILETINSEKAKDVLDYPMIILDEQGNEISTLMPTNCDQQEHIQCVVSPKVICLRESRIYNVNSNTPFDEAFLTICNDKEKDNKIGGYWKKWRLYAWHSILYLRKKNKPQYETYNYNHMYVNLPNPPDKPKYEEEFGGFQISIELCAKYVEEKTPQFSVLNTVINCAQSIKTYFEKHEQNFCADENDDIELTCYKKAKKNYTMDLMVLKSKYKSRPTMTISEYMEQRLPDLAQLLKLTPTPKYTVEIVANHIFGDTENSLPFATKAKKYFSFYKRVFEKTISITKIRSIESADQDEEDSTNSEEQFEDDAALVVNKIQTSKELNIVKLPADKIKKSLKKLVLMETDKDLNGGLRRQEVEVTVLEPIFDENIDIEALEMEILLAEPTNTIKNCLEDNLPVNEPVQSMTDVCSSDKIYSDQNILKDDLCITTVLNESEDEGNDMKHLFDNTFYSDNIAHVSVDTTQCTGELNLSEAHIETVENSLISGSFLTISNNHLDILGDVHNPALVPETGQEQSQITQDVEPRRTTPSKKKKKKPLKKNVRNAKSCFKQCQNKRKRNTVKITSPANKLKKRRSLVADEDENEAQSHRLSVPIAKNETQIIDSEIPENTSNLPDEGPLESGKEILGIENPATQLSGLMQKLRKRISRKKKAINKIVDNNRNILSHKSRTKLMKIIPASEINILERLVDDETCDKVIEANIVEKSNENVEKHRLSKPESPVIEIIKNDKKGIDKPASQLTGLMEEIFEKIAKEKQKEGTKFPLKSVSVLEESLEKCELPEGLVEKAENEISEVINTNQNSETSSADKINEESLDQSNLLESLVEDKIEKVEMKISEVIDISQNSKTSSPLQKYDNPLSQTESLVDDQVEKVEIKISEVSADDKGSVDLDQPDVPAKTSVIGKLSPSKRKQSAKLAGLIDKLFANKTSKRFKIPEEYIGIPETPISSINTTEMHKTDEDTRKTNEINFSVDKKNEINDTENEHLDEPIKSKIQSDECEVRVFTIDCEEKEPNTPTPTQLNDDKMISETVVVHEVLPVCLQPTEEKSTDYAKMTDICESRIEDKNVVTQENVKTPVSAAETIGSVVEVETEEFCLQEFKTVKTSESFDSEETAEAKNEHQDEPINSNIESDKFESRVEDKNVVTQENVQTRISAAETIGSVVGVETDELCSQEFETFKTSQSCHSEETVDAESEHLYEPMNSKIEGDQCEGVFQIDSEVKEPNSSTQTQLIENRMISEIVGVHEDLPKCLQSTEDTSSDYEKMAELCELRKEDKKVIMQEKVKTSVSVVETLGCMVEAEPEEYSLQEFETVKTSETFEFDSEENVEAENDPLTVSVNSYIENEEFDACSIQIEDEKKETSISTLKDQSYVPIIGTSVDIEPEEYPLLEIETVLTSTSESCDLEVKEVVDAENDPLTISMNPIKRNKAFECKLKEKESGFSSQKAGLEEKSLEDELCDLEVSQICALNKFNANKVISKPKTKTIAQNTQKRRKKQKAESKDMVSIAAIESIDITKNESHAKNDISLTSNGYSSMQETDSSSIELYDYVNNGTPSPSSYSVIDETIINVPIVSILMTTKSHTDSAIQAEFSSDKLLAQSPVLCVDDIEEEEKRLRNSIKERPTRAAKKICMRNLMEHKRNGRNHSIKNDSGFATNLGSNSFESSNYDHDDKIFCNRNDSNSRNNNNQSKGRTKFSKIDFKIPKNTGLNILLNNKLKFKQLREEVYKSQKRKPCFYNIPDSMYDNVAKELPCEFPPEIANKKMRIHKIKVNP